MDEDKLREYRELVAKVKLKYRENPICKGNLRLGWCDLVPGEDLCRKSIYGHTDRDLDMQRKHHISNICCWDKTLVLLRKRK